MASTIANTYLTIFNKYKAICDRCPMLNLLWNSDLSVCGNERKHYIHIGEGRRTYGKSQESGLGNKTQHVLHSHSIPGFSFNSHQGLKRWPLTSPFSNESSGAQLVSITCPGLVVEPHLSLKSVSPWAMLND